MKPGLLLALILGAIASLFSVWWFLGDEPHSSGTTESEPGAGLVVTLKPEADPIDLRASAKEGGDLAGVDARLQGSRTVGGERGRSSRAAKKLAPVAATGPYTGRLVNSFGHPIKDVKVVVERWEDALIAAEKGMPTLGIGKRERPFATTGDDGKFTVKTKDGLGRSLGVTVKVRGYSDAPIRCVLDTERDSSKSVDQRRELGDVMLQPAVIISGWVRDTSGRAVAEARVRRVDRSGDRTDEIMGRVGFGDLVDAVQTDEDGWFELPHEDAGSIALKIDGANILPKRWEGPTKQPGDVLRDVVIEVERGGRIEGVVAGYPPGRRHGAVEATLLDSPGDRNSDVFSGLPAANLSLVRSHTVDVEGNGTFAFSGLIPSARYQIRLNSKSLFVGTSHRSLAVEATASSSSGGGTPVSLEFDPGVTVSFQVLDRRTKRPIEAMKISGWYSDRIAYLQLTETAYEAPDRFVDGKVVLYELQPKNRSKKLTLKIDAEGYFRNSSVEIDLPDSGTVNHGKVWMEPAPLLNFRIVDAVTRKPVPRARVTMDPMHGDDIGVGSSAEIALGNGAVGGEATDEEKEEPAAEKEKVFGGYRIRSRGRTDRDGLCSLNLVAGGRVELEVKARGYSTHVQSPFSPPADDQEEIVVELLGSGKLQVMVTDAQNKPAEKVRVVCQRDLDGRAVKKGASTDENGFAEFGNLTDGLWKVRAYRVKAPRTATGEQGSLLHPVDWVTVKVSRSAPARVELEVPSVGNLSGIVFLNDRPLTDARVTLAKANEVKRTLRMLSNQRQSFRTGSDPMAGTTDFEGRFTLAEVMPGDYVVLVHHFDLAMMGRTDVVVAAGENSVTVEMPSARLEGRVLGDEGSPVAGAAVAVDPVLSTSVGSEDLLMVRPMPSSWIGSVKTNPDGTYKILGVQSDVELVVLVEADGYADAKSESVKLGTGERRTMPSFELELAGVLVVTRRGGVSGMDSVRVRAEPTAGRAFESGARPKSATMGVGQTRLRGLAAGTWKVTLQDVSIFGGAGMESPFATRSIEVKSGESTQLEFEE